MESKLRFGASLQQPGLVGGMLNKGAVAPVPGEMCSSSPALKLVNLVAPHMSLLLFKLPLCRILKSNAWYYSRPRTYSYVIPTSFNSQMLWGLIFLVLGEKL